MRYWLILNLLIITIKSATFEVKSFAELMKFDIKSKINLIYYYNNSVSKSNENIESLFNMVNTKFKVNILRVNSSILDSIKIDDTTLVANNLYFMYRDDISRSICHFNYKLNEQELFYYLDKKFVILQSLLPIDPRLPNPYIVPLSTTYLNDEIISCYFNKESKETLIPDRNMTLYSLFEDVTYRRKITHRVMEVNTCESLDHKKNIYLYIRKLNRLFPLNPSYMVETYDFLNSPSIEEFKLDLFEKRYIKNKSIVLIYLTYESLDEYLNNVTYARTANLIRNNDLNKEFDIKERHIIFSYSIYKDKKLFFNGLLKLIEKDSQKRKIILKEDFPLLIGIDTDRKIKTGYEYSIYYSNNKFSVKDININKNFIDSFLSESKYKIKKSKSYVSKDVNSLNYYDFKYSLEEKSDLHITEYEKHFKSLSLEYVNFIIPTYHSISKSINLLYKSLSKIQDVFIYDLNDNSSLSINNCDLSEETIFLIYDIKSKVCLPYKSKLQSESINEFLNTYVGSNYDASLLKEMLTKLEVNNKALINKSKLTEEIYSHSIN